VVLAIIDPYHKWLGIPKDQRPPTFYQLLGISPGETDAEVIDEAAIRQTAHVRMYQIGPHAQDCTRILGEISQARTTLLNPAKRKAYDAQLTRNAPRQATTDAIVAASGLPRAPAAAGTPFADLDEDIVSPRPAAEKKKRRRSTSIAKERTLLTRPLLYAIIGGGVGLLVLLVLILILAQGGTKKADTPQVAQRGDGGPKKNIPVVVNPDPEADNQEDKKVVPPVGKDAPDITRQAPKTDPTNPPPVIVGKDEAKLGFPPETFAKHFIDPDGDCKLVDANDKEGSLKLWTPAEPHDLYMGRLNAPRVLLEVEGDFTVEVRILGALVAAQGLERPDRKLSYRAGSLLVWHDDGNYIRFDRAGQMNATGVFASYMDFQNFVNGKRLVGYNARCKDEDTTLRIERKGNLFMASWQEGDVRKRLPALTVDWPAKVKFGVAAINISTQPFQAAFGGLQLSLGTAKENAGKVVDTGNPASKPPPGENTIRHYGGDTPGATACVSPVGQLLAIAGPDRDLVLVDLKTGMERKLAARSQRIHQAIFVKDGTHVLAAAREPTERLILYNIKGDVLKAIADGDKSLRWTFLAPALIKGEVLAGASDSSVHIWNLDTFNQGIRTLVHGVPVQGAISPDGLALYTAGSSPSVWISVVYYGKNNKEAIRPKLTYLAVAFAKSFDFFIMATNENKLVLNPKTSTARKGLTYEGHQAPIQAIGISSSESMAVSADEKGQISIWDLNAGTEIWRTFLPPAQGRKVEFINNDRSLLVTGNGVDIVDWVRE
jgi:hypothetical protein